MNENSKKKVFPFELCFFIEKIAVFLTKRS